jgi:hypothetical protein
VIDTCLAAPWIARRALSAVLLFIAGIVIRVLPATGSESTDSTLKAVAGCMIVAASLGLLWLGFLLRPTWKRVVAQNAAQRRERHAAGQPEHFE